MGRETGVCGRGNREERSFKNMTDFWGKELDIRYPLFQPLYKVAYSLSHIEKYC